MDTLANMPIEKGKSSVYGDRSLAARFSDQPPDVGQEFRWRKVNQFKFAHASSITPSLFLQKQLSWRPQLCKP